MTIHRCSAPLPYASADGVCYEGAPAFQHMRKRLPLRVLSPQDWRSWQEDGYVVVREAVPRADALATLAAMCEFQGMDPARPASWFRDDAEFPAGESPEKEYYAYGLVEAYHHPLLWRNRQARRVYDAFVDLWDVEQLWVALDRANLNPPNRGNRAFARPFLHWDVDVRLDPAPLRIQGILALVDSSEETGGFQCVPGLFRGFDDWKRRRIARGKPQLLDEHEAEFPELGDIEHPVVRPALRAGDLLAWNGLLLHGIAPNRSAAGVRAVQYLSMMPALEAHRALRESRVASWRARSVPAWDPSFVGDRRRPEAERYGPAPLDALGERLLGATSWSEA